MAQFSNYQKVIFHTVEGVQDRNGKKWQKTVKNTQKSAFLSESKLQL
ncbi:hypothetical protein SAMN05444144_11841 [Flavobacterium akiainvivens]|nr:hypothetical protein SAMN05444144_11841 [Flavobacterium akiainvivens]